MFTFVRDVVLQDLKKEGFIVPAHRALKKVLTTGLEALPTKMVANKNVAFCSFDRVLNLFWMPVLEYFEAFANDTAPEWTKTLALHHSALLAEMAGAIASGNEALSMDDWLQFLQSTLSKFLKVDVPTRLLLQVMSPMVPIHVEPTPANAFEDLGARCWWALQWRHNCMGCS